MAKTSRKKTTRRRATARKSSRKTIKRASKNAGISSEEILSGVLSYLTFLVLIPFFGIKKKSKFVKFHVEQGFNLLILEVILFLATIILRRVSFGVLGGVSLFVAWILIVLLTIFCIIAIIQVLRKKVWEVPLFGAFKVYSIK